MTHSHASSTSDPTCCLSPRLTDIAGGRRCATAGSGEMAQAPQFGTGAKVFGMIALLMVPYRLMTRAVPVQVAKLWIAESVAVRHLIPSDRIYGRETG